MRIVMMGPPDAAAGPIPSIMRLLSTGLTDLGHEVTMAGWGGGAHADDPLGSRIASRLRDIARVRRLAREWRPDVIVVHSAHDPGTFARDTVLALLLRPSRVPFVFELHGSDPERALRVPRGRVAMMSRCIARLSRAVLLLSSAEADDWRRVEPSGTYVVVENPYEPPAGERREPAGAAGVLSLVFAGRVVAAKGLLTVLSALGHVERPAAVRLDAYGDGPELGAAIAAAATCPADVTIHGRTSRDEVYRAMLAGDVLVLPTEWPEGFPTVLAEAMAAGMAILTTRHRGAADHLVEGVNVLFVPPRDAKVLAAAIDRLASDRALVAAMGRANRAEVSRFSPDEVARRYARVLEACLALKEGDNGGR